MNHDREVNLWFIQSGSRWAKHYFVLIGGTLRYYRDQTDMRQLGNVHVPRCSVVREGTKMKGKFHVLALYLMGTENSSRGPSSSPLLRVSSDDVNMIETWHKAFEQSMRPPASGVAAHALSKDEAKTTEEKQKTGWLRNHWHVMCGRHMYEG